MSIDRGYLSPKLYNHIPRVKILDGSRRIGDPATVYGSKKKAFHILGWKPERNIEDVISDLATDKNILNL
jgi:UDP-glucose 4-epimerase